VTIVSQIADYLKEHQRFLITSHSRPDGDAVGSQLAMALALEQLGKEVEIVNRDPFPPVYQALPAIERIRLSETAEGDFDALIILECNNLERSGVAGLERYPAINIDHHPINDQFGVFNWVDPGAAAVAELLFALFEAMEVRLTPDIASNLYAAILTDTGSFQYSNTTARTLEIASKLVRAGVVPAEISQAVLANQTLGRLHLLGKVLQTLTVDDSRRIAWIVLDRATLDSTEAESNDTEGLVNYPLNVEGIQLSAFFREDDNGSIRVSLRSKGKLDVASIASRFGGGGHRNAAGCTVEGDLETARKRVLGALRGLIGS